MGQKNFRSTLMAMSLAAVIPAAAQDTGDVWVARSAGGALKVSARGYVPDTAYFGLSPSGAFLPGWSDAEPGFDHVDGADTGLDEFPLAAGHDVWLEVVQADPAFRGIVLGEGPGGSPLYLRNPGDSFELSDPGSGGLHEHPIYHINSADPAFNPNQCVWHATFKLRDAGGTQYATSAPFTFRFSNVPVRYQADPPVAADGDFNTNGVTGLDDWPAFAECMNGPDAAPAPDDPAVADCEVECLNAFDFDDDLDVDLADYAALQRAWSH